VALSMSTHRAHDGVLCIELMGEVDLATVDALQAQIAAALNTHDVTAVVVDLAGVTFLDSTGISALLKGRRSADEHAKGYWIDAAHGMVREVLDISGVWEHLGGECRPGAQR
jgi:anti-sigma B factor antagonist